MRSIEQLDVRLEHSQRIMHISCICTFVVFYQYRLGSFTGIDTIATEATLNKSG